MTDGPVVVPYERFLERLERRRRVADELGRRKERRSPVGALALAVALPLDPRSTDTHRQGPAPPRGLGQRQI
jgi:hypothetical protein